MANRRKSINDIPDSVLAAMVRDGAYAKGTTFGVERESEARYLFVLAVPYGPDDRVETLTDALEAFFRLVQDDDYKERNIQVYDHAANNVYETTLEVVELQQEDEDAEED